MARSQWIHRERSEWCNLSGLWNSSRDASSAFATVTRAPEFDIAPIQARRIAVFAKADRLALFYLMRLDFKRMLSSSVGCLLVE